MSGLSPAALSSAAPALGRAPAPAGMCAAEGFQRALEPELRRRFLKRVHNLDVLIAPCILEVFRQQVSGAGTLRTGQDEGVPVRDLRGIHPIPGSLHRSEERRV